MVGTRAATFWRGAHDGRQTRRCPRTARLVGSVVGRCAASGRRRVERWTRSRGGRRRSLFAGELTRSPGIENQRGPLCARCLYFSGGEWVSSPRGLALWQDLYSRRSVAALALVAAL